MIQDLLEELAKRVPSLAKIIKMLKFQFCDVENAVAFLIKDTIFFTEELFREFNKEEQLFIIAHEMMHFVRNHSNKQFVSSKVKDPDLINFVEDAQINQILIKEFGLTPPKGIVILEDTLNYTEEELYCLLLPKILEIKGWSKNITEWAEFSSTDDILKSI